MKIPQDILLILEQCKIEDNTVFLPEGQLDRATYTKVNKCLENIGGKWNRKAKGHVFDYDPTESFDNLLLTGETEDMKKTFQFFPTPREVAEQMCEMAELTPDSYVLEPSIGKGDLADVIWEHGYTNYQGVDVNIIDIFGIELNTDMSKYLEEKPYHSITGVDFLTFAKDPNCWDLTQSTRTLTHIIMNPPFTRQQDLDHIRAAFELLPPGGILVSVASVSWQWRQDKKSTEFREWLYDMEARLGVDYVEIVEVDEGAFKESGTMIPTVIIKIRREGILDKKVIEPTIPETASAAKSKPNNGGFSMITNINIEKIVPHPDNPRKDLGDLTELADSIKVHGILQNLTVVPWFSEITGAPADSPKQQEELGYRVVIGHRRLAAAKIAGIDVLPCVISDMNRRTQVATMLLENIQRSDLTVYEQAQGFQMMIDLGDTVAQIAAHTGFSETTVRRRVNLLELDQAKFEKSIERGAKLTDYIELEKIKDIELRNEVLEAIGTSDFNWKLESAIKTTQCNENRPAMMEEVKKFAKEFKNPQDRYSSKYTFVDRLSFATRKPIVQPEDTDKETYFYAEEREAVSIYRVAPKAPKIVKSKEEIEREERKTRLKELFKQAYELRLVYIKSFKSGTKNKAAAQKMARHAMFLGGHFRSGVFREVFGIQEKFREYWETPEKGESFAEAYTRIMTDISESDITLLVRGAYCRMDDPDVNFCNYYGRYEVTSSNENLKTLYAYLANLGYETSAEEQALIDGTHEAYAPEPAKTEQKCRVCGCTDNQACPGGCAWVETDLCSACADPENLPEDSDYYED